MFDYDRWQEIFESLGRHKLRTLATALAVWWGIFMLVLLLGAGNGLQNSFERDFGDDALNSIWIWPERTTMEYKGFKPGRWIEFKNEDFEVLKTKVEGIDKITGRYYIPSSYLAEYKGKALPFSTRATHPDHLYLENTIITKGRYLNETDMDEYRKVCAIGKIVKEELMGKDVDPIGEYINLHGVKFKVVGEYIDEGHENEMKRIYIPITTAQRVFVGRDEINNLMVTVGDATEKQSQKIAENIRTELAALHNFSPQDKQAVYIRSNLSEYKKFNMIFTGIKFFIWIVGIGSIIAGVVGVSNIMLITVKDRTKEIGVRKAMGATPKSIVMMIMQESLFLTGVAGYFGLISGFAVVYGLDQALIASGAEIEFFYNPQVDFTSVVLALIFLVVCGTLAGLIPAMQAAKVNPVEAMRQ